MKPSEYTTSPTYMASSDLVQLWQVRFTLPQARVLLRCPPTARKDARWSIWIPRWIQWLVRIQVWRDLPSRAGLHLHASLQLGFWRCLRSAGILYRQGAQLPPSGCMVRHVGCPLRELIHHHQPLHPSRLYAPLLHLHHRLLLVQVPPSAT
jgi:hypothetical protein